MVERSILEGAKRAFLQIADGYAAFNPNLTISINWQGEEAVRVNGTDIGWTKWKTSDPPSAFWFTPDRQTRLIAAQLAYDQDRGRDRTIREFISQFRGMAGSAKQKQVLDHLGASRARLSSLASGGDINSLMVADIFDAMRAVSPTAAPPLLGIIGKEHFAETCAAYGCEPDTFAYKRIADFDGGGMPFVVEAAFGWVDGEYHRKSLFGINFASALGSPFRQLGTGSLDTLLANQHCNWDEPIVLMLHVTTPKIEFLDRGKSTAVLSPGIAQAVLACVKSVTSKWAKQRKREERDTQAKLRRRDAMTRTREATAVDVCDEHLEQAWLDASGDGELPATARQVFYAIREKVRLLTGKEMKYRYFSQTILPDHIERFERDWDVVFDARGNFVEPHTALKVPLGTLEVRKYLERISEHENPDDKPSFHLDTNFPTCGSEHRIRAMLFIEKEGFLPLFEHIKLAARYDLAIASTKGMSVIACRQLAQAICGPDCPLLIVHDFDVAGMTIAGTLQHDTRRFKFTKDFPVFDLGLRIEDIDGLETEQVEIDPKSINKKTATLRRYGASQAEIEYLLVRKRRVELNALKSPKMVAWLEGKLKELGIGKLIPPDDTMKLAAIRAAKIALMQKAMRKIEAGKMPVKIPDDLPKQVRDLLIKHPAMSWDSAVVHIMGGMPK